MTDIVEFLSRLDARLKKHKQQRTYTPATFAAIDKIVADAFSESKAEHKLLLFIGGVKIVGGKSFVTHDKPDELRIKWETEFHPHPRRGKQPGIAIPLGYYDEYDLYLGIQSPFPPTLIARYSKKPEDYTTYNTVVSGTSKLNEAGAHFVHAFNRARDLGFLTAEGRPIIAKER